MTPAEEAALRRRIDELIDEDEEAPPPPDMTFLAPRGEPVGRVDLDAIADLQDPEREPGMWQSAEAYSGPYSRSYHLDDRPASQPVAPRPPPARGVRASRRAHFPRQDPVNATDWERFTIFGVQLSELTHAGLVDSMRRQDWADRVIGSKLWQVADHILYGLHSVMCRPDVDPSRAVVELADGLASALEFVGGWRPRWPMAQTSYYYMEIIIGTRTRRATAVPLIPASQQVWSGSDLTWIGPLVGIDPAADRDVEPIIWWRYAVGRIRPWLSMVELTTRHQLDLERYRGMTVGQFEHALRASGEASAGLARGFGEAVRRIEVARVGLSLPSLWIEHGRDGDRVFYTLERRPLRGRIAEAADYAGSTAYAMGGMVRLTLAVEAEDPVRVLRVAPDASKVGVLHACNELGVALDLADDATWTWLARWPDDGIADPGPDVRAEARAALRSTSVISGSAGLITPVT